MLTFGAASGALFDQRPANAAMRPVVRANGGATRKNHSFPFKTIHFHSSQGDADPRARRTLCAL
jgi:hypothetical protein